LIDTIGGFRRESRGRSSDSKFLFRLFCGFLLLLRGLFLWLFIAVVVVSAFAFGLDDFVEALRVFLLEHSVAAEEVNQGSFFLAVVVPFFDISFVAFEERFALRLKLSDLGRWFVPEFQGNSQLDFDTLVD
jgi:hypothetical protein